VNYLFLKEGTLSELRGLYKDGRTQIPLQFLVGEEGGPVAYERCASTGTASPWL
jgi:CRISPR-associated protein Cas5h